MESESSQILDAHASAPALLRAVYKHYQKLTIPEILQDKSIVDFSYKPTKEYEQGYHKIGDFPTTRMKSLYQFREDGESSGQPRTPDTPNSEIIPIFELESLPG